MGEFKGNKSLKKKVRREYKALKKSGDVKVARKAGLSKKEMKDSIRKSIAEKAVVRKRNVRVKKASDNIAKKESSVATSKDMATEKANRSAERQASMQSKADVANKDIKSKKAKGANNERIIANKKAKAAVKPGESFMMIMKGGRKIKAFREDRNNPNKKYNKAQEGGKVKSKSVGVLKSDTNKAGPKMEPGKEPYTENGINYTWDRKNSVWIGDVKGNEGVGKKSRAVKKK